MNLWLIVPGKSFRLGKSRLSPILTVDERAEVSRAMLTHVLATAHNAALFAGVMVVSRDRHVLEIAQRLGAEGLMERQRGLNPALEQARLAVTRRAAQAILVLPGDLPLLTGADINALVTRAESAPGVVIAPSHTGGTNALLLRPPTAIPFAFGRNSFARHVSLARRAGLPITVVESPTLCADVDSPDDWQRWMKDWGQGAAGK